MDVELDLEVDLGVVGPVDVGCHWRVPSKQYAEKSTQYITANNSNSDIKHQRLKNKVTAPASCSMQSKGMKIPCSIKHHISGSRGNKRL